MILVLFVKEITQDRSRSMLDCWAPRPLGLGQCCTHMVSCEAHSPLVQVIPAVLLPISYKSNHGLISPRDKSPWATHQISTSFCTTHQMHLGPWAKTIPQRGLRFPKGEQPTLPSPSTDLYILWGLHLLLQHVGSFVWAEPGQLVDHLVLTSQVASAKFTFQSFHPPAPYAVNCIVQSFHRVVGDRVHGAPYQYHVSGLGAYEVISEMSCIVWLYTFWGTLTQNFTFKAQVGISSNGVFHRGCLLSPSWCVHHTHALAGSEQWSSRAKLPGLAMLISQVPSSLCSGETLLTWVTWLQSTFHVGDGLNTQGHPSITSPFFPLCLPQLLPWSWILQAFSCYFFPLSFGGGEWEWLGGHQAVGQR